MMLSILMAIFLTAINPEPILLKSAVDLARIIGLPRMKTFDKHVIRVINLNEMDSSQTYLTNTRKEFFNNYFKFSPVRVK